MSTALAQYDLGREKIDLIKQTVAKGSTDLELELFLHACKRTGLDPLMKQIYAIKRWNGKLQREEMSIQTGIDGYRLIADRTGCYAGSDEPKYEEAEQDVKPWPFKATVTVYKMVAGQRCAFSASALWDEYCQLTKEGKPMSLWGKMPYLMLAKCAEALALRKAFPAELSGVYTHEEMMQAENEQKTIEVEPKPSLKPSDILKRSETPQPEPQGAVLEPSTSEALQDMGVDDPTMLYRRKIRAAETEKACREAYDATPEELKQDVHNEYFDTLKAMGKKKAK